MENPESLKLKPHARRQRRLRKVLERLAVWGWNIPVVCVVAPLIFGYSSTLSGGNSFLAAGIVFWVAMIYGGGKVLHYLWSHETGPRGALVLFVWAVCFGLCVYESLRLGRLNEVSKALRVHTLGCNLIGLTSKVDQYYVESHGLPGLVLIGVNLVVTFNVTNASKDPLRLGAFAVQYSTFVSGWKSITALGDGRIFSPNPEDPDIHRSLQWQVVNVQSVNTLFNHPIEPEKDAPAYAFFRYPKDFETAGKKMRLKVCDGDNDCVYSPIDTKSEGPRPGACFAMGLVPGYTDISDHSFAE